jgi:hypothetical protein
VIGPGLQDGAHSRRSGRPTGMWRLARGGDPHWQRHLLQIGPMTAGLAIQATANLQNLPIGPWPGLGVLAAWTAAALLAGGLLLRLRDA